VEMAVYMAAHKLKTSPEAQKEVGLSESQYNKRCRLIEKGKCRKVSVVVRCQDCCRFLFRFEDFKLPVLDMECGC